MGRAYPEIDIYSGYAVGVLTGTSRIRRRALVTIKTASCGERARPWQDRAARRPLDRSQPEDD
jgi:hypothetical protein